jgi:PE-PPE domain
VYNTGVGSAAPASDDTFVVFGYSQSATIGTFEKRSLAAEFPDGGGPDVSFTFTGNGNRPNGGFLARGPEGFTIPGGLIFGGATFSGATPTNTQYKTADIAGQYDIWADVPLNPLNLVAVPTGIRAMCITTTRTSASVTRASSTRVSSATPRTT